MLKLPSISMDVFRRAVLSGLASLVVIPAGVAVSGTLREEAVAYRTQGYESQRRGDATEAFSSYQKAAALDPSYPTPHNDLGVLLEEQGRLQEAEQSYRLALVLNPDYMEAHANLAMLYERMGERGKAIPHWLKRYELGETSDPGTLRAEARLAALGVSASQLGPKGQTASSRRVADHEFQAQARSREEYRAVTEAHGDWP